ncbi:hypothetical protein BDZ97DRAFT_1886061 [Flammula alnicola]|nr:hypothetical protein BDZ97DRAFT_1886061 [Flammula alnicola]
MTNTPTPLFLRCLPSSIFPVFQKFCPLFLLHPSGYTFTWHNYASQNRPDRYLNTRQGRRLDYIPAIHITADGRTWWRCEHPYCTFQYILGSMAAHDHDLSLARTPTLNPSSSPGIRVSTPQSIKCTKNTDGEHRPFNWSNYNTGPFPTFSAPIIYFLFPSKHTGSHGRVAQLFQAP